MVDDGSTDGTARLLEHEPGIRVISLPENRGKGAAVRAGVLAAHGDLVLVSDADLAAPLGEVAVLREAIDRGNDIAIGSRGLRDAHVLVHQRRHRELMGKAFNVIVRRLIGLPFRDTQCGFKLFRRDAAGTLFDDLATTGFAFDVEILARAHRAGLAVAEVPITWRDKPGTTVSLFGSSSRMLLDVFRIRYRLLDTADAAVLRRVALFAASTALLFWLSPHAGAISDGLRYQLIAKAPWSNRVGTPWALRIGVPLIARALPFSLRTSFYLLACLSVFGTALLVSAIVRELGLPERHALAGGILSTWTTLSVTCFWTYYVDVHVLLLVAAAVYLAARGRTRLAPLLVGGGALVKEIVVLVGPLVGLVGGRRTLRSAALATSLGLVAYILLVAILPTRSDLHQGGVLHAQLQDTRVWLDALRRIGIIKYTGNAVLSTFGLGWLLWPSGFRAAGGWLRRSVWWIPLTLPLFLTTQWERTFAFYLPLLVPLALLAIPRMRAGLLAVFTVANAWIAGGVETFTVGDGTVTPAAHKLLLMSPGLVVAAAVLLVSWLGVRGTFRGRLLLGP